MPNRIQLTRKSDKGRITRFKVLYQHDELEPFLQFECIFCSTVKSVQHFVHIAQQVDFKVGTSVFFMALNTLTEVFSEHFEICISVLERSKAHTSFVSIQ